MANRNNYAAKLELKRQNRTSAGLISERYPEVADIAIRMTYYQHRSDAVMLVRKVNIFPTSHAYFRMDCITKGCEDGGFDLTPVIKGMVKERKKGKKGVLHCRGKLDAAADGHAHVEYEVVMRYNKSSR